MDHQSDHRATGVISFKAIKRENLTYIWVWVVYYAWVVAFTTWWTAPAGTGTAFSGDYRSVIQIVNMISSAACVFAFKKERFTYTARLGAVALLPALALFFIATSPLLKTAAAVLLGALLGCVNISILIPFVFRLNNTEKLCAVVFSQAISCALPLIADSLSRTAESLLAVGVLAVALFQVFFFEKLETNEPAEDKLVAHKSARPAVILTIVSSVLGAVVFLGAGKAILNMNVFSSGTAVVTWYYLGGIAGSILYVFIFILPRGSIHMALSLPFGCAAAGLLCNTYAARTTEIATVFALLLGIGTATGMSTVYYILGVVGKKFNSMLYVRLSILLIGICGGVTGVLIGSGIGRLTDSAQILVPVTMASFVAVILVLIFSPTIARVCFAENWAGDMTLSEIQELREAIAQAVQHDERPEKRADELLSMEEMEVAMLLLEGETRYGISRKLHKPVGDVGLSIENIREKVVRKGDPDPGIAVAVRRFSLTRRETDTLRCLCRSMTNAAIAAELIISEETAKKHVHSLMKKLPVDERKDVAAWVKALGYAD